MTLVGHKTESMYRRYAIVAESDLRDWRRETGGHLPAFSQVSQEGLEIVELRACPRPHPVLGRPTQLQW